MEVEKQEEKQETEEVKVPEVVQVNKVQAYTDIPFDPIRKIDELYINSLNGTNWDTYDATNEKIANKDTTTTLGTSNTKYPSQLAVKTFVENRTSYPGALISRTVSSAENYDTSFTTTFLPKTIIIWFQLLGAGGGGADRYAGGVATFDGTAVKSVKYDYMDITGATGLLPTHTTFLGATYNPSTGDDDPNDASVTLSVTAVTVTGFTVRLAFVGASMPGNRYGKYMAVAIP